MRQQFRLVTVLGVVVATLPALKYAPSVERVGSVESALESAVSWPVRESIVDRVLAAAKRTTTNTAGHREVDLGEGHHFVLVPAGSFRMGSDEGLDDERPTRDIELDDYWIAKYPVTVGQFRAFVEATGYVTDAESGQGSWQWTGEVPEEGERGDPWEPRLDGGWNNIYFEQGDDHPVGSVSWNDAQAFCAWLSSELGLAVVLPTEAQWEKAARGTEGRRFPWGNEAPDGRRANYADANFVGKYGPHTRRPDAEVDDGYVETSPVGAYDPGQSPYGIYDMAGNLGEWVYDIYDRGYYAGSPRRNPSGPERPAGVADADIDRVNRGGSWVDWAGVDADGRVAPEGGHSIRAAARTGDEQNSSDDHMGFRIAIDGLRIAEAPSTASQKPDLAGVEIVTHAVSGNIYMLEATGDVAGNIAVSVGPDGILVVDDQWAELTRAITKALRALDGGALRFIINTHHHDDHSDGNANLAGGSDALVVAHERARERLLSKDSAHWPVITFNEALSLHFNGEEVRALAIPGGHTDNDVVVFFTGSNVVHLGDLFNSGTSSFPTADLQSGGNALAMLANLDALLPMIPDDAAVIPGHGPLSGKAELYRVRKMLDDTINLVRIRKAAGRSLEEIIAAGLGREYEGWGYGYMSADGWIEMIYNSLDGGP
ncbi:MAG TPA: SUMF1/EgtB/PvdO family nonheme iron enzyme [Acidobacteriota bacterium]|nr:SUMF1/EgtB/PvdO family nonheme iron enzyme [Acidobacteriota bacterium]